MDTHGGQILGLKVGSGWQEGQARFYGGGGAFRGLKVPPILDDYLMNETSRKPTT